MEILTRGEAFGAENPALAASRCKTNEKERNTEKERNKNKNKQTQTYKNSTFNQTKHNLVVTLKRLPIIPAYVSETARFVVNGCLTFRAEERFDVAKVNSVLATVKTVTVDYVGED